VNLVFDIFQGIGVAAAVGIRPFLPSLAVGALALGDVEIQFKHSDMSWLQGAPFLLAMGGLAIVFLVLEWRLGPAKLSKRIFAIPFGLIAAALGAILFAGSLCRGGYAIWPGIIAGVICAAVGIAASRPLFARVRKRLDAGTAKALPIYAEIAALLAGALSIVAPPFGPIFLALLLWLIFSGRRREGQKYAGLRILR
jgi:hypothetical protein